MRRQGVIAKVNDFGDCLLKENIATKVPIGNAFVYAVQEAPAYDLLCEKIKADPFYMIEKNFDMKDVETLPKIFQLQSEMVSL